MHILKLTGRAVMLFCLSQILVLFLPRTFSAAQERSAAASTHSKMSLRRPHRFPDAGEKPIANWSGPVFSLSQNYPLWMPTAESQPWKKYNFSKEDEWKDYLASVLHYCMEGNVENDWVLQKNTIRHWYHAPWMHWGPNGREFIHGLTHERGSRPKELAPTQVTAFQNWAVGMYNGPGGWVIGKVWKDADHPDPNAFKQFPDGTVSIKLLFTEADTTYLVGSKEWDAYIYDKIENPINPNGVRKVKKCAWSR